MYKSTLNALIFEYNQTIMGLNQLLFTVIKCSPNI